MEFLLTGFYLLLTLSRNMMCFEHNADQHRYNTRQSLTSVKIQRYGASGSKSFQCVEVKNWNSLLDNVRASKSIKFLKTTWKEEMYAACGLFCIVSIVLFMYMSHLFFFSLFLSFLNVWKSVLCLGHLMTK